MANFILTEEQYRQIVENNTTTQYKTVKQQNSDGSVVAKTVPQQQVPKVAQDAAREAVKGASDPRKKTGISIQTTDQSGNPVSSSNTTQTSTTQPLKCGRIITKKQLREMRLKRLKENSVVYKLGDFLRK